MLSGKAYFLGVGLALDSFGLHKSAAQLTNPFQLVPDRPLSDTELVVMIRQAIIAEHDAAAQYALQAEATKDPLVKKTLLSIADEERVHVGELSRLLQHLTKNEDELMASGAKEVEN